MEPLVTIELFGQPYTFRADTEIGKARRVADTLVKEVAKIESQQSEPSAHMTRLTIMILAALNIANENHDLRMKYSELITQISKRSTRLIGLLDTGPP